jgi:ribonuclease Z
VISGDSAPSRAVVAASCDADLLIHEATFCEDERERAEETRHSTAAQAAQVALAARVKLLALTHVSTRYFGPEVRREARELFAATVVPRDFDIIELPFQERGEPRLIKGGALPVEGGETEAEPAVRAAGVEEKSE